MTVGWKEFLDNAKEAYRMVARKEAESATVEVTVGAGLQLEFSVSSETDRELEDLSREELEQYLEKMEEKRLRLEDAEPEEKESCESWVKEIEGLEEKIREAEDVLEDLDW